MTAPTNNDNNPMPNETPDNPPSLWLGVILHTDSSTLASITFMSIEQSAYKLARMLDQKWNPTFHADLFDTNWFEKREGLSISHDAGSYAILRITERMLLPTGLAVVNRAEHEKMCAIIARAAAHITPTRTPAEGPLFTHLHQRWVRDALEARNKRESEERANIELRKAVGAVGAAIDEGRVTSRPDRIDPITDSHKEQES